jgi:hypothetical protein
VTKTREELQRVMAEASEALAALDCEERHAAQRARVGRAFCRKVDYTGEDACDVPPECRSGPQYALALHADYQGNLELFTFEETVPGHFNVCHETSWNLDADWVEITREEFVRAWQEFHLAQEHQFLKALGC